MRSLLVILGIVLAAGDANAERPSVVRRLAEAIRFETISHQDPALDDPGVFAAFRDFLERSYPNVHRELGREIVGGRSLLFTWKGPDRRAAGGALLLAHQDVVPVEEASADAWTHAPFEGVIDGGFVWGRGALDDKGPLVAILEAVEALLVEGARPRRTIYLAFGHDEEVGGFRGAAEVAKLLSERSVRVDFALDEGRAVIEGILPDVPGPVAWIGTAEKGYLSLELRVRMKGGHSSMPERETPIGVLAAAVARLQERPMPASIDGPVRVALERLAPRMPFFRRLAAMNLWLFEPLVIRRFEEKPATNAFVRTTTAPTIFQAGVKDNVLPSEAYAIVNFRLLRPDTVETVTARVREIIDDERVRLTPKMRFDPSPESSTTSEAYRGLEDTIARFFPEAAVVPTLVTGATDARHYAAVAGDVYRFTPRRDTLDDLKRFHGVDERARIEDLERAVAFYRAVVARAAAIE